MVPFFRNFSWVLYRQTNSTLSFQGDYKGLEGSEVFVTQAYPYDSLEQVPTNFLKRAKCRGAKQHPRPFTDFGGRYITFHMRFDIKTTTMSTSSSISTRTTTTATTTTTKSSSTLE